MEKVKIGSFAPDVLFTSPTLLFLHILLKITTIMDISYKFAPLKPEFNKR